MVNMLRSSRCLKFGVVVPGCGCGCGCDGIFLLDSDVTGGLVRGMSIQHNGLK